LLLSAIAAASDNGPLPGFLVGVWSTDESLFIGDSLVVGEAIYISSNGGGILLCRGEDGPFSAARLHILTYNYDQKIVTFDIVRKGKVVASRKILVYDKAKQWLVLSDTHFYRRFHLITAKSRTDLALAE